MEIAVLIRVVAALGLQALVAGAACAAPLMADAPASGPENGSAQSQAVGQMATGSRQTVDLLIELQPRSAGLEFNQRSRPGGARDTALPSAAGANSLLPAPERAPGQQSAQQPALFGAGAVPQTQTRKAAEGDWQRSSSPASPGEPARQGAGSGADSRPSFWVLFPRELVAYVRENRNWVIGGAAALLALMWGGSMMVGRMRR